MNYLKIFKKYWYLVVLIIFCGTLLSFVLSIVQTPKYVSSVNLLIIQQQGNRLDAYSASRSAEIISKVLSKMVYTSSFFERVKATNFNLDNKFSEDPEKRQKEWEKTVKTNASGDGSLKIEVYHPDRNMAENYALAIAYVLVNHGKDYHGGDNTVEIKMVDKPYTSTRIASPNLAQNVTLGAVGGLLLSISLGLFLSFKKEENNLKNESGISDSGALNKKEDSRMEEVIEVDKRPLIPVTERKFEKGFPDGKPVREESRISNFESRGKESDEKEIQAPADAKIAVVNSKNLKSQGGEIKIPSPFSRKESGSGNQEVGIRNQESGEEKKKKNSNEIRNLKEEKLPSIFDEVEKKVEVGKEKKDESKSAGLERPKLPVFESKKKGQLPKDLKRNLKKDFYHPESVDAWVKSGKFKPQDV